MYISLYSVFNIGFYSVVNIGLYFVFFHAFTTDIFWTGIRRASTAVVVSDVNGTGSQHQPPSVSHFRHRGTACTENPLPAWQPKLAGGEFCEFEMIIWCLLLSNEFIVKSYFPRYYIKRRKKLMYVCFLLGRNNTACTFLACING